MYRAFIDRKEAGRELAGKLGAYAGRDDVVVLALPRGGVPVAFEVAQALHAALDLLIVRKLGVPFNPGLAMGAIGRGSALYVDRSIMAMCGVSEGELERVITAERQELERREKLYRGDRQAVPVKGRTVVVVDDGIATGASMRAALMALRAAAPAWIVVAVPVAPREAQERIGTAADEFVCVVSADDFSAVGQFYRNFDQTSDDEVRGLLDRASELPDRR